MTRSFAEIRRANQRQDAEMHRRRMERSNAIKQSCPKKGCGAGPNEPCQRVGGRTRATLHKPHKERIEAGKAQARKERGIR